MARRRTDPLLDEIDGLLVGGDADALLDEIDAALSAPDPVETTPAARPAPDPTRFGPTPDEVRDVVRYAPVYEHLAPPLPEDATPLERATIRQTDRQRVLEQLPPAPGAVPAPPVPALQRGLDTARHAIEQNPVVNFNRALISGAGGIVSGVGGALEAVGTADPALGGARAPGALLSRAGQAVQETFAPPEAIAKDVLAEPRVLLDPNWWAYTAGQGAGSAAAFVVPALAAERGLAAAQQAVTWSDRVRKGLTLVGGTAAGTATEALVEGGLAYNDAIAAGKSPQEAGEIAARVASRNAALIGLTAGAGWLGPRLANVGGVTRGVAGAAMEGVQEGGQEVIQNLETDRPLLEGVGSGVIAGALVGGGLSAVETPAEQLPSIDDLRAARKAERAERIAQAQALGTSPADETTIPSSGGLELAADVPLQPAEASASPASPVAPAPEAEAEAGAPVAAPSGPAATAPVSDPVVAAVDQVLESVPLPVDAAPQAGLVSTTTSTPPAERPTPAAPEPTADPVVRQVDAALEQTAPLDEPAPVPSGTRLTPDDYEARYWRYGKPAEPPPVGRGRKGAQARTQWEENQASARAGARWWHKHDLHYVQLLEGQAFTPEALRPLSDLELARLHVAVTAEQRLAGRMRALLAPVEDPRLDAIEAETDRRADNRLQVPLPPQITEPGRARKQWDGTMRQDEWTRRFAQPDKRRYVPIVLGPDEAYVLFGTSGRPTDPQRGVRLVPREQWTDRTLTFQEYDDALSAGHGLYSAADFEAADPIVYEEERLSVDAIRGNARGVVFTDPTGKEWVSTGTSADLIPQAAAPQVRPEPPVRSKPASTRTKAATTAPPPPVPTVQEPVASEDWDAAITAVADVQRARLEDMQELRIRRDSLLHAFVNRRMDVATTTKLQDLERELARVEAEYDEAWQQLATQVDVDVETMRAEVEGRAPTRGLPLPLGPAEGATLPAPSEGTPDAADARGIEDRPAGEPAPPVSPAAGEPDARPRPPVAAGPGEGGRGRGDRQRPRTGRGSGAREGGLSTAHGERHRPRSSARRIPRLTGLNFTIDETAARTIGVGTPTERFAANLEAIRLVKQLEAEARQATPEEQAVLARYVGWGDTALVARLKNNWKDRSALEELVTPDEFTSIMRSTPNAHYTAIPVIRALWQGVERLGFTGGRVLEPAMGVGHFFGAMPPAMRSASVLAGVELDSLTARIAQQLYQGAFVVPAGLQDAGLPTSHFDLVISNVPFGDYGISDAAFRGRPPALSAAIHDYFFAKGLDLVRPGGLVVFVTSHHTLDKQSPIVRRHLARHAELLGAVRLPRSAFEENAGTSVTTDVLFLQRRAEPLHESAAADVPWVGLDTLADVAHEWRGRGEAVINRYFLDHPGMVLGQHFIGRGLRSPEEYQVRAAQETGPLEDAVAAALRALPATVYQPAVEVPDVPARAPETRVPAPGDYSREGTLVVQDGKVFVRRGASLEEDVERSQDRATVKRLTSYGDVRTALRQVQQAMLNAASTEAEIRTAQKALDKAYATFVKRHGYLTDAVNFRAYQDDTDAPLIAALEHRLVDPKDRKKVTVRKADIFTKRVISPGATPITQIDTAQDALLAVLSERGRIDWPRMAEVAGRSVEDLRQALTGVVFETPEGDWQIADQYLSGNVREKLRVARAAARLDPDRYRANVEALEAVQPEDIPASEITITLGMPIVAEELVTQFVHEEIGRAPVRYTPQNHQWSVGNGTVSKGAIYGTRRVTALDILEESLNGKAVTIFDRTADDKRVINQPETEEAREKQRQLQERFSLWVWENEARSKALHRLYNDTFNAVRIVEPDGSHLTFPGMNPAVQLRPHQKNVVWRILSGGQNTLMAHVVGAGKTYAIIAAAGEMRRMGLARKPLIVVPNHLPGQWARDFATVYPAANVLVVQSDDLTAKKRRSFLARVATGDYDAIVITHAAFGKVPVSLPRLERFMHAQIAELTAAIEAARVADGKNARTVKELEKSKLRLEKKLKDLAATWNKDDSITFEELGVDALFVDESHEFKNLWYATQHGRISGIQPGQAQKAFDMLLKSDYITELNNGRNVVFATGTPMSNTLGEAYIVMRYLQARLLKQLGLEHFDAWKQQFATTATTWEVGLTGRGMRQKERFSKFVNAPELNRLTRLVMDVKNEEDLNLPKPKAKYTLVDVAPTSEVERLMAGLIELAERLKQKKGKPTKGEDNHLTLTTKGKKLALDARLLDPSAADDPGSKLNRAIDEIHARYTTWAAHRGAQLVFSDMGTPKPGQAFSLYDELKRKLVARGIPETEIAFIHDVDKFTGKKRQLAEREALFDRVRRGDVRVLIGSTMKMGAGMNVQNRLVAVHHLDAPWRPADLEQRNGRIVRQGNELLQEVPGFEVEVLNYVTKRTFDAYVWQTLERKWAFIKEFMKGNVTQRTIEDIGEIVTVNFANAKAIASDQAEVMEYTQVEFDLQRLERLWKRHRDAQQEARWRLESARAAQGPAAASIDLWKAFEAERELPDKKDWSLTLQGKRLDRKAAGDALMQLLDGWKPKAEGGAETKRIGIFAGLPLHAVAHAKQAIVENRLQTVLEKGVLLGDPMAETHVFWFRTPSTTGVSLIAALDALAVDQIPHRRKGAEYHLDQLQDKEAQAQRVIDQPFQQADALERARTRLKELQAILALGDQAPADTPAVVTEDVLEEAEDDDASDEPAGMAAKMLTGPRGLRGRIRLPLPPVPTRRTVNPDQQRLDQIIQRLSNLFNRLPIVTGKVNPRNLGQYHIEGQSVRVRVSNDVQVIAHEVGHHIDIALSQHSAAHRRGAIAQELKRLGVATAPPAADAKKLRREGAAEFVRLWLLEPESVARLAPQYTAAFDAWLARQPIVHELLEIRRQLQGYLSLDPGVQLDLHIDFDGEPGLWRRAVEWATGSDADPRTGFQRLVDLLEDDKAAIARMERDLGPTDLGESAYALHRLLSGTGQQAQTFLEDGVRDLEGRFTGPSLFGAIRPVWSRLRDFSRYLVAKRAEELHARDLETGLTNVQVAAGLALEDETFKAAADNVYHYFDTLLAYAVERGYLSPESAVRMKQQNVFYVPFHRVERAATDVGKAPTATPTTRAKAHIGSFFKRFKGSGGRIVDPIVSAIKNTHALVAMVEQNYARLRLVDLAREAADGHRWLQQIRPDQLPTSFNLERVAGAIREQLETMGVELPDNADFDRLAMVFTPAVIPIGQRGIITVMRQGKREWYEVHDQGLWDALTKAPQKAMDPWWRVLQKLARGLKATATAPLGFVQRNLVRDHLDAKTKAQYQHTFFGTLRAARLIIRNDESWQLFRASRAGQATVVAQDRDYAKRQIARLGKSDARAIVEHLVFHPFDSLRALSELSENSTRLQAFTKTLAQLEASGGGRTAGDLVAAAMAARDITQDFTKLGAAVRPINDYVAFFGAHVGGWMRMKQAIQERPAQYLRRAFVYGVLPGLLLWSLNHDDDDYQERIPDWAKRYFWHIKVPGTHAFIWLPRPFDIGDVGATLEAYLTWAVDHDPDAVRHLPWHNRDEAWRLLLGLLPTALLPYVEVAMNYNTFTRRPIVSPYDLHLDVEQQYNRWTSETGRRVGPWIGLAPAQFDHLVQGYTAGSGRALLQLVDVITNPLRPVAKPAPPLSAYPVIGTFYRGEALSGSAQSLERLYRREQELAGRKRAHDRYLEAGQPEKASAIAREFPHLPEELRRLRAAKRQLEKLREQVDAVFQAPDRTALEKRAKLDDIYEQMVNVARQALGKGPLRSSKEHGLPMPIPAAPAAPSHGAAPPVPMAP